MTTIASEESLIHRPIYQWQEFVEDLEEYQEGGYHPVRIGDVYSNGRYQIIHKLGFASYSTVWLAKDVKSDRYVALKIIVAEASEASSEDRILRHLRKTYSPILAGYRYLPILWDSFTINGPNGQHRCLVTKPARSSIDSLKGASNKWLMPIEFARAIVAQAILGMQCIHSSGVIHGGKSYPEMTCSRNRQLTIEDLYIQNLLLSLPEIDFLSQSEIYDMLGTPREFEITRLDGAPPGPQAPTHSVQPARLAIKSGKLSDPRICISDFGEAWLKTDTKIKKDLHTPVPSRPPEAVFENSLLGFPADIWTLACTIHEIMGQQPLFECFAPDMDYIIAEMVSCLRILPQRWWHVWQARNEFFHEDGSWRTDMTRPHDAKSRPLAQRLQQNGRILDDNFSESERYCLENMLKAMLEYEPTKRATANDLVNSEWMRQWGLPSLRQFKLET